MTHAVLLIMGWQKVIMHVCYIWFRFYVPVNSFILFSVAISRAW